MYFFYFSHAILCPEHKSHLKQWSISDFAIIAKDSFFWLSIVTSSQLICDVTQMLGTGIVMAYLSIVPARRNECKGDLHNSEQTNVNIDFAPPGIHNLACKKAHCLMNLVIYVHEICHYFFSKSEYSIIIFVYHW